MFCRPSGLPNASTSWPVRSSSESPIGSAGSVPASTFTTARSVSRSRPITSPATLRTLGDRIERPTGRQRNLDAQALGPADDVGVGHDVAGGIDDHAGSRAALGGHEIGRPRREAVVGHVGGSEDLHHRRPDGARRGLERRAEIGADGGLAGRRLREGRRGGRHRQHPGGRAAGRPGRARCESFAFDTSRSVRHRVPASRRLTRRSASSPLPSPARRSAPVPAAAGARVHHRRARRRSHESRVRHIAVISNTASALCGRSCGSFCRQASTRSSTARGTVDGARPRRRHRRVLHVAHQLLHAAVVPEHLLAGQQEVGDAADRVDVGAAVDVGLADDRLRRHVGRRAEDAGFAGEQPSPRARGARAAPGRSRAP